ncbi:unnamed protein product [Mesocestoides corti]|uniref:LMBR1 domain-containing protein 2 n=1 Tax=Mesocestoides corti TaxID=53468 RepID=A0A0R3UEC6_MESCO|nr:unnamed protein product [Mesocestoides corti]
MESYAGSGEFTVLRKLRSAFIDNAIIYGSYLVLFICVMVYLLVKRAISFDASSLKVLLITTSNTWGLFLVILFLGYGLVEVPRAVLRAASPISRLRFLYFNLSKRYLEYIEDEEELKIVLSASEIGDADKLQTSSARSGVDSRTSSPAAPTLQRLVKVHKRLKKAHHHCSRARALWLEAVQQAASAEDVCNNCTAGGYSPRVFERGPAPAVLRNTGLEAKQASMMQRLIGAKALTVEWYWRCLLWPLLLRGLGVLLAAVSLLVIWSECTFFVQHPRLSVIAAILHSQSTSYNLIAFCSFLSLGYLGFCVYFTAYRLRFFNYYRLVPNHHSDAISLIFYGYMLCRVTPSLCLNFLCLAHLDSHVLPSPGVPQTNVTSTNETSANVTAASVYYETAFTKFMGHLDVVSFIADGFNIYFPITVVILCLFTFFSLGRRILACIGVPQLIDVNFTEKHLAAGESSAVGDAIEDGRMLLYRERTLGRTRRFAGGIDKADVRDRQKMVGKLSKSGAPYTNAGFEVEAQSESELDQAFSPNQPIVEFSEEKLNAMFQPNLPASTRVSDTGFNSGGQYASLEGESRPLLSKVVSSLQRMFVPR